jgi:signal transduction histidine kinase
MLDHEVGCFLEISGICLVATDSEGTPSGFKILVPGASHIRMVEPASWFTVPRLLVLLSTTLGVLLLAASHAFFSARRNMRLLAEIGERRAVTAERSRLARDLHDTLEQGLTGIHLQLHSISPALEDASAETQERLMSVRSLVLQCHTEMRQSIWDLRPAALEQFDLGDALKRIADSLVLDSGVQVQLHQQRNQVKIPPLIEDNLLRIGQESLTNAVKHARATILTIELRATPGHVQLTISDNGSSGGSLESKPGHFGLVGMRERSIRIGGELTITRNSDGGCSVQVDVPLPSQQRNHVTRDPKPHPYPDR